MLSDVVSSIRSTMGTLFTGSAAKTELSNPYDLEDNAEVKLRNSFGVRVLEGGVANGPFNQTWVGQTIGIVLVRDINSLDNDPEPMINQIGNIHADMTTIKKELLCNKPTGSISIVFAGHGAIDSTGGKYVSSELLFTITLSENLT